MTDNANYVSRIPQLQSRWWTLVLALSLMVNLLIAGAVIGHRFRPHRDDMMQFIPHNFIASLSNQRRGEIIDILRNSKDQLKSMRDASDATALKLADALQNYDAANVKSIIDSYTTGSTSFAAKRGQIFNDMITKLTAEERQALALAIKERAARR
jgi:hypothetical protein